MSYAPKAAFVFKPIRNDWALSKERLPVAKQIMERYLIKAPPPSNSIPIINPYDSPALINFSKPCYNQILQQICTNLV